MALSAAAHHSFDKVAAGEKYNALRGQKTDRARREVEELARRQMPPPPRGAASLGGRAAGGAGTGAATHRGAEDRRLAVRADPRCSRAAGGGQRDGFLSCLGPADTQVFVFSVSFSCSYPSPANGGTVGGSSDCIFSCSAPAAYCLANRRHSCSAWSWCSSSSRFSPRTSYNSVARRADR